MAVKRYQHPQLNVILMELRQGLEALYGDRLAEVILYGSQARGDADPESDIDVLVVLKGRVNPRDEHQRVSDLVWELTYKYDTLVSCMVMSQAKYVKNETGLLWNIHREGTPV